MHNSPCPPRTLETLSRTACTPGITGMYVYTCYINVPTPVAGGTNACVRDGQIVCARVAHKIGRLFFYFFFTRIFTVQTRRERRPRLVAPNTHVRTRVPVHVYTHDSRSIHVTAVNHWAILSGVRITCVLYRYIYARKYGSI